MNLLKRFEIWVLLLLVGGVIAFVLATANQNDSAAPPENGGAGPDHGATDTASSAAFTVDESTLRRDVGNGILEIHITFRNDTGQDLELSSPTARLTSGATDSTTEVRSFFLAFSPPPTVRAGETSSVVLKFWLEKEHLVDALWLRIRDDVVPVKSAAPFELESIPNQDTVAFKGIEWPSTP